MVTFNEIKNQLNIALEYLRKAEVELERLDNLRSDLRMLNRRIRNVKVEKEKKNLEWDKKELEEEKELLEKKEEELKKKVSSWEEQVIFLQNKLTEFEGKGNKQITIHSISFISLVM